MSTAQTTVDLGFDQLLGKLPNRLAGDELREACGASQDSHPQAWERVACWGKAPWHAHSEHWPLDFINIS